MIIATSFHLQKVQTDIWSNILTFSYSNYSCQPVRNEVDDKGLQYDNIYA